MPVQGGASVVIDHFEELPFASQSIDLAVLPHVLSSSPRIRTRCCAKSIACCARRAG